jgi:hypothetical protein
MTNLNSVTELTSKGVPTILLFDNRRPRGSLPEIRANVTAASSSIRGKVGRV